MKHRLFNNVLTVFFTLTFTPSLLATALNDPIAGYAMKDAYLNSLLSQKHPEAMAKKAIQNKIESYKVWRHQSNMTDEERTIYKRVKAEQRVLAYEEE